MTRGPKKGYQKFSKRSESDRDRISRLPKEDQERYAEEALNELEDSGRMGEFARSVESEFGLPPTTPVNPGKGGKSK